MRLTVDHSPGAAAVSVPCLECGKMIRLADAKIDVDGPAFQAYYHPKCVPVGAPVARHSAACPFGCRRGE